MDRVFKASSQYSLIIDGTQEPSEHGGSLLGGSPTSGDLKRASSQHPSYDVRHGNLSRMPTMRIKKSRVMRWLVLSHTGDRQLLNLEKRQLKQMFGLDLPIRDMRLLDSQLVDFKTMGTILVRDNVILVSMEHVRCIITAQKVIVPVEDNEKSEVCNRFCMWLESMVQEYVAEAVAEKQRLERGDADEEGGEGPASPSFSSHRPPMHIPGRSRVSQSQGERLALAPCLNEVPFELHVLEVALGEVSTHLAREAEVLQAQAHPALEELTREADQPVLERVRRIKTSHQRLLGRVKLVREVLERLMEDDGDMMRMTLTRSLNLQLQQQQIQMRHLSPSPSGTSPAFDGLKESGSHFSPGLDLNPQTLAFPSSYTRSPSLSLRGPRGRIIQENTGGSDGVDPEDDASHDLLDVENLLESFFMHLDSTLYSLNQLGELVEDTEDLVNLSLDYSRNKLIRFDIIITCGTFALAMFSAVAGMLGENLPIPPFVAESALSFCLVNIGVLLVSATCFFLIIAVLVRSKLI